MKLEELKKIREKNFLKYKNKKKEYYLKRKVQNKFNSKNFIDYEAELSGVNFKEKIKQIVKNQKEYIDNRVDKIILKIEEYKLQKHNYYKSNKKKRLDYDKEYREAKKDELKKYRKKYYERNKTKK